ncbi:hypothetical protein [Faecalibacillus intestinalis]|nr:hypothetical protein [Faecalibacillus intestinalis]
MKKKYGSKMDESKKILRKNLKMVARRKCYKERKEEALKKL